jgi:hypothetical protein
MPLAEFSTPEITDEYLRSLDMDQLIDLLMHKTNGLIVASRTDLHGTEMADKIRGEVHKIHAEIKARPKEIQG